MVSTQPPASYLTCQSECKTYDDTKPHCPFCHKWGINCPGHTNLEYSNKQDKSPQMVPNPHASASQETTLMYTGESGFDLATSQASYKGPITSPITGILPQIQVMEISNRLAVSPLYGSSLPDSSIGCGIPESSSVEAANIHPILTSLSTSANATITSVPTGFLGVSPNLAQVLNLDLPQHTQPTSGLPLAPNRTLVPSQSPSGTEKHDDRHPEGAVSVVYRQPVLDKTAESNALPFVLQAYATWLNRMALDPLKLKGDTRNLVCSHFEDGEQSRWIIGLLANIGSRVGSMELVVGRPNPMISMLKNAVRRRIGAVKSRPNPERSELVKALESITETIVLNFFVGSISEVVTLVHEAAPIFRQLCQEPPDAPIDLQMLLDHPLSYLRYYAHIDILFSVVMDMPPLFQYKVAISGSQLPYHYRSAPASRGDGFLQWLHGIPNEIILLFTKLKSMRQDELTITIEMIAALEREIQELPPFNGSSSNWFLAIMRSIVQECWRQAAFVYLYMAICGDLSDTPRVKEAFKRYIRLLNGTKPGCMPDEFLSLSLEIVLPAAQRQHDREVIRRRILGLYVRNRAHIADTSVMLTIDDLWARADAEGRAVVWSDVAVSWEHVLKI